MIPPKILQLAISKLHSILVVPNLLVHNNITISYYGQVNSLRLKSSVDSKWASKHIWEVPFILILMVHSIMTAEYRISLQGPVDKKKTYLYQ